MFAPGRRLQQPAESPRYLRGYHYTVWLARGRDTILQVSDFKCPHAVTCPLYPQFSLKGALRIWQKRYCEHETQHKTCERFVRSAAGQAVPATLLPNGQTIG
jgi:hypothetical protein